MQWPRGIVVILARREHEQVLIGRQRDGRELPLDKVVRVVGKIPALKIFGLRSLVVKFDPVRVLTRVVGKHAGIGGHELANHNRKDLPRFQRLQSAPGSLCAVPLAPLKA